MSDITPQQYLTPAQVSQTLGISLSSVYRRARDPGFPAIRVGSLIRIPRDAFEFWLAAQLPCPINGSEPADEPAPTPEPELLAVEVGACIPFSALLAVREELNLILPPPPSPEHLGMALIEEIGELVRTLRYGIWDRLGQDWEPGWRWWYWGKEKYEGSATITPDVVLEELADILHLILLSKTYFCPGDIIPDEFWEDCWGKDGRKGWSQTHMLTWIPSGIFMRQDHRQALYYFAALCESLGEGFGRREVDHAYLAKAEANKLRQGGKGK